MTDTTPERWTAAEVEAWGPVVTAQHLNSLAAQLEAAQRTNADLNESIETLESGIRATQGQVRKLREALTDELRRRGLNEAEVMHYLSSLTDTASQEKP